MNSTERAFWGKSRLGSSPAEIYKAERGRKGKNQPVEWLMEEKRSDLNCLWVVNTLPWYFEVSRSLCFLRSLLCPFQLFPRPFSLIHLYIHTYTSPFACSPNVLEKCSVLNRKKFWEKLTAYRDFSTSRENLRGGLNCLKVLYYQSSPKIPCWRLGLRKFTLPVFPVHSALGRSKRVQESVSLQAPSQKTSLVFLWVARISCWLLLLLHFLRKKEKKKAVCSRLLHFFKGL